MAGMRSSSLLTRCVALAAGAERGSQAERADQAGPVLAAGHGLLAPQIAQGRSWPEVQPIGTMPAAEIPPRLWLAVD